MDESLVNCTAYSKKLRGVSVSEPPLVVNGDFVCIYMERMSAARASRAHM